MKNSILGILFVVGCVGIAWAQQSSIQKLSILGPATAANSAANNNHANGTADVTIASGGGAVRNCLTSLDAIAAGAYTIRVLNGGTTIYALSLTANQGIVRDWDEDSALCGSANTAMSIKITTTAAGAYSINYQGYTY